MPFWQKQPLPLFFLRSWSLRGILAQIKNHTGGAFPLPFLQLFAWKFTHPDLISNVHRGRSINVFTQHHYFNFVKTDKTSSCWGKYIAELTHYHNCAVCNVGDRWNNINMYTQIKILLCSQHLQKANRVICSGFSLAVNKFLLRFSVTH